MGATNTTKQFLKNYDSGILFPYTTLDCILADEDSNLIGTDAIISNILAKDDILIYEKNITHNGDRYIHQANLNGENLSMLGIYNNGEGNTFIKMHPISDDESSSNKYLGADGDVHTIGNGAGDDIDIFQSNLSGLLGNTVNNRWFEGTVTFDSSSCSIVLEPRVNSEDFYVSGGELRVRTADHVKQAQVLVSQETNSPYDIGSATNPYLIRFLNGMPQRNQGANVGAPNKIMYLEDGVFKTSVTEDIGGIDYDSENNIVGFRPIYMAKGIIKDFSSNGSNNSGLSCFGGETPSGSTPKAYALCVKDGSFIKNDVSIGADNNLIYLDNGEFKASTLTIGDNNTPVALINGKLQKLSVNGTGNSQGIGNTSTPVYLTTAGAIASVTEVDYHLLKSPNDTEGSIPYLIFNEHGNNSWKTITQLFVNYIGAVTKSPEGANTTNKRDEIIVAHDNGNNMQLMWKVMPNAVEITNENHASDSENAFYLTGVYGGPIENTTAWNNYHDKLNGTAKKLEVAVSDLYRQTSGTSGESDGVGDDPVAVTGIYFKGCKLYQTSDARLKTFVSDLKDDYNLLENIATIKKGKFYWSNDENQKLDIGVTAQTVEQYFPEIVDEDQGIKTVSYSKLGVIALAAIDKLNEKIKSLEKEIEELKSTK